mgnify:CR=1 FL=1
MHWVGGRTTEGVLTFKEVAGWDSIALVKLAVVVPRRSDVLVVVGDGADHLCGVAGVALGLRVGVKDLAVSRSKSQFGKRPMALGGGL